MNITTGAGAVTAPANLGPLAVQLVREAIAANPTGDANRVVAFIRRRTFGWHKSERIRLLAVLAWVAGDLARRLPPNELEQVLAVAAGSSAEQLARLAAELLRPGSSS